MAHKTSIATISLGWHPSHTLERKIIAAASSGFQGVEIFIADLDSFAESHRLVRLEAAHQIKKLCHKAHLQIVSLASFQNFEGERSSLDARLEKAAEWVGLVHALGTDIIQIPSNDSKNAIGEQAIIIRELQILAELGARQDPPVNFAYEALAWGTHVADWEESLRIVELVDRPNFKLCLDTYHVVARIWADPMLHSGLRPGGPATLRNTIQRFLDTCPSDKILYIQLSDAEKMSPPILPGHPAYQVNKDGPHAWCLYGRLFPLEGEKDAYFPMKEILRAWLRDKQWSGWVSMEVFHRDMNQESQGPESWARRGQTSWDRVMKILAS